MNGWAESGSLVPGTHNALNALAAIAIGMHLKIPFEKIANGLQEFCGVKRRFEIRWQDPMRNRVIIDDYGHHPTEIAATLAAARQYWKGRIVTVFQPHRYTRTLHCRDGFLSAFRNTDELWVTDIYAAGEDPIPGVDSRSLVQDIQKVSLGLSESSTWGILLPCGLALWARSGTET